MKTGLAFACGAAAVCIVLQLLWLSTSHAADPLVSMLEQRFVMQPGQTRVLPECGCTIRYLGTSVNGRHYVVRIDKLD